MRAKQEEPQDQLSKVSENKASWSATGAPVRAATVACDRRRATGRRERREPSGAAALNPWKSRGSAL